MPGNFLSWAYEKLGSRYPTFFVAVELQAGLLVTAGTVLLLSLYYDGSLEQYALILAVALVLTAIALLQGFLRLRPSLRPVSAWIAGRRDPRSTAQAWSAAIGVPLDIVRLELLFPILAVIVPGTATAIVVLDLAWTAFFPLAAAALVAVGYGAILHYLTIEAGMRPVLVDINRSVGPRTGVRTSTLSLRVKLLAALPMINVITGLLVAAITGDSGGAERLGIAVLVAIGVATTISLELTLLLSRSILSPLIDLRRATEAVRKGDFNAEVPVTTGDELGELAASFNHMLSGLRERERIREAFGVYLDKEVADYILSEGFSEQGFEAEVSIVFCDVRDFTSFAAGAEAEDVVARLNSLFEVVVPVIGAQGGHVDKFEGDGLMAVFGAPQTYRDHAERAVRAAVEIDRRVNQRGEGGPFELGIGINTGRVVAGSIGGGGRLNFSVIGDAVNIAARVESATRSTGDAVLMTAATRAKLGSGFEAEPRGEHELKGLDRSVVLYAPVAPRLTGAEPVSA
jgi:adenylate cyclase